MLDIVTRIPVVFSLCLIAAAAVLRQRQSPNTQVIWVTEYTTELTDVTATASELVTIIAPVIPPSEFISQNDSDSTDYPILLLPPSSFSSDNDTSPDDTSSSSRTYTLTDTTTSILTDVVTSTIIEASRTVTISQPPKTITDVITVTSTPSPISDATYWAAPAQFSNLDSFKITNFADGSSNLQIVDGLPATATSNIIDSTTTPKSGAVLRYLDALSNSSSILQLFYPANSLNPGNSDASVGGADFYASPLRLENAQSVTLEYSVFFPVGFQWVKGGKLPGLYGGHMQCSGGDDATTCFSTRLMWREDGAGELYLYAPKDKQTTSLCRAPPLSFCDSSYGLSVGRGSFYFTPGSWTTVTQKVTLNTPGEQDGGFTLQVDGKVVLNRSDVFYRDVSRPSQTGSSSGPESTSTQSEGGGLLSPLLGDVLDDALLPLKVIEGVSSGEGKPPLLPNVKPFSESPITDDAASQLIQSMSANGSPDFSAFNAITTYETLAMATTTDATPVTSTTLTSYVFLASQQTLPPGLFGLQASGEDSPIGFSGLFFSTFFGGSSKDYATPEDQYVWFKDFSMSINA